nr:fibrohexamerin-like protein 3 [Pseudoips prasinana]
MKVCLVFLASLYFCSANHVCNSTGNDDDGIVRPCPNYDRRCVGRVFADELQCDLIPGKIPDRRIIRFLPLHYPRANSSIHYSDAVVKGVNNFTINEFYINRKNNTLVLEIVFKFLETEAPSRGFFYRKGKEPIVTYGRTYIGYRNYSLTLIVYNVDGRRCRDMSDYQVYTYVSDVHPPIGYDKCFAPTDPQAYKQFLQLIQHWEYSIREKGVTQGPLYMNLVLPCDLKISDYMV